VCGGGLGGFNNDVTYMMLVETGGYVDRWIISAGAGTGAGAGVGAGADWC
jgi:hypothetical protein